MTPTHPIHLLDQVNQRAERYIDTGDLSSVTCIPGQEICTERVTFVIPLYSLTRLLQGWKSYWYCANTPLQMVFTLKCSNAQIGKPIFAEGGSLLMTPICGAKKSTTIVKIGGFRNLECLNNSF